MCHSAIGALSFPPIYALHLPPFFTYSGLIKHFSFIYFWLYWVFIAAGQAFSDCSELVHRL